MVKDKRNQEKKEQTISTVEQTNDRLTNRAGLSVFAMYMRNILGDL
ncbi:hypothetical protein [Prosthecochloris sp. ZM]|nr:hypothetical protein [Prosthecochloris sp. ZM]